MMSNNLHRYPAFAEAIRRRPEWPRVMCFGDSWFQYPGPRPTDIQKQLPRLFKRSLFYNEGVAGRTSAMYKRGRDRVTRALGEYGFDVLLLSMGGNDVVGSEMAEFVKERDAPQHAGTRDWGVIPWQVRDHLRLSAFDATLRYLADDFVEMIQRRDLVQPNCEIFLHQYDYIWPSGTKFKLGPIKAGPWVKPFLDAVGLTKDTDQRAITNWLLDQFAQVLDEVASQYPRVSVIRSLGTLTQRRQWKDEIHPSPAGFRKIATDCWKPALTGLLE